MTRQRERLPGTREPARRLGLVALGQMTAALVAAVENPASGIRVVEAREIRRSTMARHQCGRET